MASGRITPNISIAILVFPFFSHSSFFYVCLCCFSVLRGCRVCAAVAPGRKVFYAHAWIGAQACGHCDGDLLRAQNIPGFLQASWVPAGPWCNSGTTSGKLTNIRGWLLSPGYLGKLREGGHAGPSWNSPDPAVPSVGTALTTYCWGQRIAARVIGQTGKERRKWQLSLLAYCLCFLEIVAPNHVCEWGCPVLTYP